MSEKVNSIRILHVDDDPDLAELVSTYLRREDSHFEVVSAGSASDGLDTLAETDIDCVVSDYDMPERNGIELLEAVRERDADLPFILFTAKGSEDIASDAISAGVTDYLQKGVGTDQYAVLANRIRNVVDKWRAEREAERTKRRLEAIAENSSDAILTVDSTNTIQFVNQATEDLFGYDPETLRGDSLFTLIPERYRDGHRQGMERFLETNDRSLDWTAIEFSAQHREGHEVPVSISFSTFKEGGERKFVGVLRDISERVRMEDELRERERRFRQMAENIQEMVWMTDPTKGEVLYVNPAYEEIWGRSPDALYEDPQSFADAIHPEDRDRVEEILDPQSTGSYEEEYRIVRPNGETRWVYDRAVPVKNEAGEVYRTVGIASDITERREREREFDRVVELLDHTERVADVGGWEVDPKTGDAFWSDHLFELIGWEGDRAPSLEDVVDIYVEEDRPRVEAAVENALTHGESFAIEARLQRSNGEDRWMEIRGDPHVENGEVTTLRGAVHDITERKQRERALHELYDVTSDPDLSFDEKVQALLRLGRRELGTEYGTLSSIHDDEYVFEFVDTDRETIQPGDVVPVSATNCELVASTRQTVVIGDVERDAPEETGRAGFTEWGISSYIGAPVFDTGDVYGTFCFYDTAARADRFTDWEETLVDLMSNWVTVELQRKRTTEQPRDQNEQLSQFASIVSHDLRNPLNVAKGRLELVREEYDGEHIDAVRRSHERMQDLIDDLLALARVGEQMGELERVNPAEVASDCWRTVATTEATLRTAISRSVRADESRFRQLFENLISNAIEHGGEDVTVTVGELDDGFYVEDTGVGIPEENRDSVFEPGYSTTRNGTGFGLHIVNQVVKAHGWDIRVTTGARDGARFEVTGVEFSSE
ncbi:PAS domain S-box protein [Halorubrum ezzemoulense]|uniref:PAS domain S-box protein n=1 Tax=Halorubrum ezzemoulense TaxID=337243 RepID=UPI002330462E|nr:PAS domain S-box protein [Halorubrum ezzemoulense]MDB2270529.1 PAS domain S-box protein [Halorubrum ezzemoulense]